MGDAGRTRSSLPARALPAGHSPEEPHLGLRCQEGGRGGWGTHTRRWEGCRVPAPPSTHCAWAPRDPHVLCCCVAQSLILIEEPVRARSWAAGPAGLAGEASEPVAAPCHRGLAFTPPKPPQPDSPAAGVHPAQAGQVPQVPPGMAALGRAQQGSQVQQPPGWPCPSLRKAAAQDSLPTSSVGLVQTTLTCKLRVTVWCLMA